MGENAATYRALTSLLNRPPVRLVDADGNAVTVPPELGEAIYALVTLLAAGKAVHVTGIDRALTTQQAADLLGVSRPTLIRLLDDGAISHTRVRSHRRIRLDDLLTYRDRQRAERRRLLDDMVRMSEELGAYDVTPEELAAFRVAVHPDDDMFDEDAVK